ncbi:HigA family addiction module antitoxin [Sphingomonas sp. 7/4-4]|uniref:HigA family addiction module antitoxin n=1 Tax=Sphingomonas sp. 7/4-4 TaxID=3018446 RepID=UPI0022F3BC75|nr:HigA family addiction module antitoxin [Sphingomonas sp. 7/4-4]WBY06910.1 HigA family addiction module antitoxin [Sphingomonas sp. 7/4-4]
MPTTENQFIERNEFLTDLYPIHPGVMLKVEVLPTHKVTGSALADAISATQPSVAKVLNGKGPITPALAARIEAATGYSAALLCKMQTAYDLAEVRRENQARLESIPRLAAFA